MKKLLVILAVTAVAGLFLLLRTSGGVPEGNRIVELDGKERSEAVALAESVVRLRAENNWNALREVIRPIDQAGTRRNMELLADLAGTDFSTAGVSKTANSGAYVFLDFSRNGSDYRMTLWRNEGRLLFEQVAERKK